MCRNSSTKTEFREKRQGCRCSFYKERDMAEFISETLDEEKLIELLPEYLYRYDIRQNEFKDRDKREKAISEITGKVMQSSEIIFKSNQMKTIFNSTSKLNTVFKSLQK